MNRFAKRGLIVGASIFGLVVIARLAGIGFGSLPGANSARASLSLEKSRTVHQNISSSQTSTSDQAGFSSGRVVILLDDPPPFLREVASQLAERLRNSEWIDEIDIVSASSDPGQPGLAPDLFLRLELLEFEKKGLVSGEMKAAMACYFGTALWQSHHHVWNSSTPPRVQFAWNANLSSQTDYVGINSDRFEKTAQSVAGELADAISKELKKTGAKFPALPELPKPFYGPYEGIEDFAVLKEFDARRRWSHYGLFTHNETYWTLPTATNPVPSLQRMSEWFEADGWGRYSAVLTNTENHHVRMEKGDAVLEIFRVQRDRLGSSSRGPEITEMDFAVRYVKLFTKEEREAALETFLAEDRHLDSMITFFSHFSPVQRERFLALVRKAPSASPNACLRLAEHEMQSGETNAAWRTLLGAKALVAAVDDPGGYEARIRSLADKISPGQKLDLKVTPEICRELGFLEFTGSPRTFEVERDLGRALLMFGLGSRGVEVCSVAILPSRQEHYICRLAKAEENLRSTSKNSFQFNSDGTWQETVALNDRRIQVAATLLPDTGRVKYIVATE